MEFDKIKTACFTGYRPHKFNFPLNGCEYNIFTKRLFDEIANSIEAGYNTFIIGCAPGFDIIAGEITILAQRVYIKREIRLVCDLPYKNFRESKHFSKHWRGRYDCVMKHCHEVVNVTGVTGWSAACYDKRNRFMINNSSLLLCYSTGKKGGT